MSKQSGLRLSEQKKTFVAGVLVAVLAAANLVPLHYADRQDCPGGGSFTTSGITMGVPTAYYRTVHGGMDNCPGIVGGSSSNGFSAQALLTDALVFGAAIVGLNVLLDRRTKA